MAQAVVRIKVVLHSIYREKLPRGAKGKAIITLAPASTVGDALAHLGIAPEALCTVNGEIERNRGRLLQEGDQIEVFVRIGGG